jgi:hypothetical protein
MASVLMYSLIKKLPEDKSPSKPSLRFVTVGSVLIRFGCIVMVKINRVMVLKQLLLFHKFSFGINGDVQQVIMSGTITLDTRPSENDLAKTPYLSRVPLLGSKPVLRDRRGDTMRVISASLPWVEAQE